MKSLAKPTTIDPMLKPSEVEQMVGLSRQRLYVLMKDGPIQEKWRRPTPFALLLPRI